MAKDKRKLKYARAHISCANSCTVAKWKEKAIAKAFRLVEASSPKESDFLPTTLMNPQRQFATKPEECRAWALSFFNSVEKAKRRRDVVAQISNYFKDRLHFVSETMIQPVDGRVSPTNKFGHFGVHEYVHNQLLEHAKPAIKITT